MHNSSITIHGGQPLCGEIRLAGAKNAALPMLVAAAMGELPTTLENVPVGLNDVQVMIELLQAIGADVAVEGTRVICSRGRFSGSAVPPELARRIRYSLVLLGACAALGEPVFIPQPGGCSLGDRKYDLHLMGLRKLGATIDEQPDGIMLQSQGLQGAQVDFYLPTTSGTENIMLAATLARGVTTIRNANTRPEIQQLGKLLAAMGASITVRNRIVNVEGVHHLKGGVTFTVMPGWDEAVTYMVAAGATRGEVAIVDFDLENVAEDVRYLRVAGIDVFAWRNSVFVSGKGEKHPFDLFTAPYPGVNSDMQPIFAALALNIAGTSTITDLRFTDRFQYVDELKKFGGDIESFGNTAVVQGGRALQGVEVVAPDLRGGMACMLAGLTAEGTTVVGNAYQVERGYEDVVGKFTALGASIEGCAL